MDEERYMILKMLEEGRISAEEAAALLEALGGEETEEVDGKGERPHPGSGRRRRKPGPGPSHCRAWDWDREAFAHSMEEMRRQLERVRLGAIDIGDEVSRQVQEALNACREDWSRGGRRSFRHFMRDIGDVFAIPHGREVHEEDFEEEVEVDPTGEVELKVLTGDAAVSAWDRDLVRVEARKRVWAATAEEAARRAADYKIEVTREGGRVSIGARLADDAPGWIPARCRIDYNICVPARSRVKVAATNGDVTVAGVQGGAHLYATNGEVVTENLGGNIAVRSTNGDIVLRRAAADSLSLRAVNGDAKVELSSLGPGESSLSLVRGDAVILLPPGLSLDVQASTLHGDIRSGLPGTIRTRTATRLETRLGPATEGAAGEGTGSEGPARPSLAVRTVFGDITIERREEE